MENPEQVEAVELEKKKKEFDEKIQKLDVGEGTDFLVNSSVIETQWFTGRDKNGVEKKYKIEMIHIPYDEHLRLTIEAWKEAMEDVKFFSYLMQVKVMKRTWRSFGGVTVDAVFWTRVDPGVVESIRMNIYGPSEIDIKPDQELLKNLTSGLLNYLQTTMPGIEAHIQTLAKAQGVTPISEQK